MNSEVSNQFTFKASSSHFQRGREQNILTEPSNQQNSKNNSTRKYKIFQQSTLFSKSPPKNKQVTISPKVYKTQAKDSTKPIQNSLTTYKTIANSQRRQLTNNYIQLAKNTLDYKTTSNGSEKEKILNELARKDREINILKLQLERARRCQQLNKTNQQLYQQIINTLPNTQIAKNKEKQHERVNYTPIQSLREIIFTPSKQPTVNPATPTRRQNNHIVSTNKYSQSKPLKTIPQNQQTQIQDKLSPKIAHHNKIVSHYRRKVNLSLQSKLYQADPLYIKIQFQMNDSMRSRSRTNTHDIPLNMRLREMNTTLEHNYQNYTRRNSTKHSSHRTNQDEIYYRARHHRY